MQQIGRYLDSFYILKNVPTKGLLRSNYISPSMFSLKNLKDSLKDRTICLLISGAALICIPFCFVNVICNVGKVVLELIRKNKTEIKKAKENLLFGCSVLLASPLTTIALFIRGIAAAILHTRFLIKVERIALLVIDIQNDFASKNGALYVKDGEQIVPVVNKLMKDYRFAEIIASVDSHPKGHSSFASSNPGATAFTPNPNEKGSLYWPDHCVQGTWGEELVKNLKFNRPIKLIFKGTNPKVDSYSAFLDNDKVQKTELSQYLNDKKINRLIVVGLATDYCVKNSVIDGRSYGYPTTVVSDACRAVDASEKGPSGYAQENSEKAFNQMKEAGAVVITSSQMNDKSRIK